MANPFQLELKRFPDAGAPREIDPATAGALPSSSGGAPPATIKAELKALLGAMPRSYMVNRQTLHHLLGLAQKNYDRKLQEHAASARAQMPRPLNDVERQNWEERNLTEGARRHNIEATGDSRRALLGLQGDEVTARTNRTNQSADIDAGRLIPTLSTGEQFILDQRGAKARSDADAADYDAQFNRNRVGLQTGAIHPQLTPQEEQLQNLELRRNDYEADAARRRRDLVGLPAPRTPDQARKERYDADQAEWDAQGSRLDVEHYGEPEQLTPQEAESWDLKNQGQRNLNDLTQRRGVTEGARADQVKAKTRRIEMEPPKAAPGAKPGAPAGGQRPTKPQKSYEETQDDYVEKGLGAWRASHRDEAIAEQERIDQDGYIYNGTATPEAKILSAEDEERKRLAAEFQQRYPRNSFNRPAAGGAVTAQKAAIDQKIADLQRRLEGGEFDAGGEAR